MGCDIHFVVEEHFHDRWVGIYASEARILWPRKFDEESNPVICLMDRRNYRFFAALAGVRGDGPAPNGLPNDVSELTRLLVSYWDGDGHSHGHCSLIEVTEKWERARFPTNESTAKSLLGEHRHAEGIFEQSGLENYRVCFWFDN